MRSTARPLASLVLGLALAAGLAAPAHAQLASGEFAPDFTLDDTLTGQPISLSDFAGEVRVLYFVGWG